MREIYGAGVGLSADVLVGAIGDDDFRNSMIEIIFQVVLHAIGFGLVEPDDDDSVVLVGLGCHDCRNNLAQKIIALQDLRGIAGQAFVTRAERGVHVVELIRSNPVVVRNSASGQIVEQLLQRSVV